MNDNKFLLLKTDIKLLSLVASIFKINCTKVGHIYLLQYLCNRTIHILYHRIVQCHKLKITFFSGIRHDTSLILPIRQTASIFKQPVTVVKNRPESKTRSDLKHGPQEPPKQVLFIITFFSNISIMKVFISSNRPQTCISTSL